jgi:hypothetical protein
MHTPRRHFSEVFEIVQQEIDSCSTTRACLLPIHSYLSSIPYFKWHHHLLDGTLGRRHSNFFFFSDLIIVDLQK